MVHPEEVKFKAQVYFFVSVLTELPHETCRWKHSPIFYVFRPAWVFPSAPRHHPSCGLVPTWWSILPPAGQADLLRLANAHSVWKERKLSKAWGNVNSEDGPELQQRRRRDGRGITPTNKQNQFSTKQNKLRNNCQITHSNSDFSRMFNSKYIEVKLKYSNNIEPNITLCRKTGWGTTKLTILMWCWGQELWVRVTCSKAYHSELVQQHWVLWVSHKQQSIPFWISATTLGALGQSHKQQKHTILNWCWDRVLWVRATESSRLKIAFTLFRARCNLEREKVQLRRVRITCQKPFGNTLSLTVLQSNGFLSLPTSITFTPPMLSKLHWILTSANSNTTDFKFCLFSPLMPPPPPNFPWENLRGDNKVHTHTCMCTHTHTRTHTHTHAHLCTYTHTSMHTHTHMHAQWQTNKSSSSSSDCHQHSHVGIIFHHILLGRASDGVMVHEGGLIAACILQTPIAVVQRLHQILLLLLHHLSQHYSVQNLHWSEKIRQRLGKWWQKSAWDEVKKEKHPKNISVTSN